MNVDDLTGAEERLLAHMRAMGGWVSAPLAADEHEVMGDLIAKKFAVLVETGPRRYAFTEAGAALAEEIAASR